MVSLPVRVPCASSFSCALRSSREADGTGSGVLTQLPPSLSSFNALTAVSFQGSIPKGVHGIPGSRYICLPPRSTMTRLELSCCGFITAGLKKYRSRVETRARSACRPSARASALGLQADLALVSTRDRYFFNPAVMNPQQLNSSLVIVDLGGKQMYLDPGIPCTPFGMLPWNETAVRALKLDKDGGSWVNTPLPVPSASRLERKAQLKLDAQGTLTGKLTIRYTGLEAGWRRFEERNEDDTDRKQFLEDQLKLTVPSGINVTLTNTPDWSHADEPLVAEYDLKVPGWASAAGQRQLVRVALFGNEDDRAFAHAMRTQPIYFEFPYEHADDIRIEMPAGRHIDSLPRGSSTTDNIERLSYTLAVENEGGVLHLSRQISVHVLLLKV